MPTDLAAALAAASGVSESIGGVILPSGSAKLSLFSELLATHAAKPGFNIDALDSGGRTLLQQACMRRSQNQAMLVQLLLDRKASASLADATGSTALYYAALSGCLPAVDLLKAAAGDGFGAVMDVANANGETPLMAAAASGATEVCGLLIASGADLGARATAGMHEGRGALLIARCNNFTRTADFLKTKDPVALARAQAEAARRSEVDGPR